MCGEVRRLHDWNTTVGGVSIGSARAKKAKSSKKSKKSAPWCESDRRDPIGGRPIGNWGETIIGELEAKISKMAGVCIRW